MNALAVINQLPLICVLFIFFETQTKCVFIILIIRYSALKLFKCLILKNDDRKWIYSVLLYRDSNLEYTLKVQRYDKTIDQVVELVSLNIFWIEYMTVIGYKQILQKIFENYLVLTIILS